MRLHYQLFQIGRLLPKSLCGVWHVPYTQDPTKITCPNCVRKLEIKREQK